MKLVPITIGHDDGDTVQVVSGLDANTPIISNPPDSVIEGEKVHVLQNSGQKYRNRDSEHETLDNL